MFIALLEVAAENASDEPKQMRMLDGKRSWGSCDGANLDTGDSPLEKALGIRSRGNARVDYCVF